MSASTPEAPAAFVTNATGYAGIPALHHVVTDWKAAAGGIGWLVEMLANAGVGIVTGGIVVAAVTLFQKLRGKKPAAAH